MSVVSLRTIRAWRFRRGRLVSASNRALFTERYIYESSYVESDTLPTMAGNGGFYSVMPDKFLKVIKDWPPDVVGLVNNRGLIQVHEDGTVRSQSIEIEKLFVDSKKVAIDQCVILQQYYGVPIVYTDSLKKAFHDWLKKNESLVKAQYGIAEAFKVTTWEGEDKIEVMNYESPRKKATTWEEITSTCLAIVIMAIFSFGVVALFVNTRYGVGFIPEMYSTNLSMTTIEEVISKNKGYEIVRFVGTNDKGENEFLLARKPLSRWSFIWSYISGNYLDSEPLYLKVTKIE